jgi:hypothetical protein
MSNAKKNAKEVIEYFRGNADEFEMLKGLICACNAMNDSDRNQFTKLIDRMVIAERMDEVRKETIDKAIAALGIK